MRKMAIPVLALAVAPPLAAQVARLDDAQLKIYLDPGQYVEARGDGDLTGDGVPDVAFVGRSEDKRTLKVLRTDRCAVDVDFATIGTLDLDPAPQGAAEIAVAKGVLKITELTGGSTATQAVYRYRYEPASKRMRLIGLDATVYSRTYAHDGYAVSWNLLTGAVVRREMKLNTRGGDKAYDPIVEKRSTQPSKPLYMETTPDVDALLGRE